MIKLFDENKNCCGCFACQNICPKNAITITEDELGSTYPVINNMRCIECGLCKKVCNFQNRKVYAEQQKAFAAVTKNKEILMKSASGGIFATLAIDFIKQGGYVAGAVYDDKFNVIHIVSNKLEDVKKMQGSKYVQSSTKDVFKKIKELLNDGKKVLFSGTPCQVDGLYGFLMKPYASLVTVDIVCHGVPSNSFFKKYLSSLCDKGEKIIDISFRDKQQAWEKKGKIVIQGNDQIKECKMNSGNSEYYYLFNKNGIFRESCYSCKYASLDRPADITIGDFWGIEEVEPELVKNKALDISNGVSLVILNTPKGETLFYNDRDFYIYASTLEKVSRYNHNLNRPSLPDRQRNTYVSLYTKAGIDMFKRLLAKDMRKERLKLKLKQLLPNHLKSFLKKIMR